MFQLSRFGKIISPFAAIAMWIAAAPASASDATSGLPWEAPLSLIQQSLTGPVATTIAVLALFAAGAALVFGDEMSSFVKRILVGVMALSMLIFSTKLLSALGLSGFTI